MPITIKKPRSAEPTFKQGYGLKDLVGASEGSTVDRVGEGIGSLARIGSSFIGASGGWPGAAAGAGGEALAQFLEGSINKTSLPRIGVEAGLGAIPFGRIASGARAATAVGKTAAISSAGDVGRQWSEGAFDDPNDSHEWNKGRTALATLLGGGAGFVMNKLSPGLPPPPKAPDVIVESSGAVPRFQSGTGLGVRPPINEAPPSATPFTNRETIASGKTELSAGRSEPPSTNYSGGVGSIQSLPATTSRAATIISGPRTLAGNVPYGAAPIADAVASETPRLTMSLEDEMMEMLNKIPKQPLTSAPKQLDQVLGNIDEGRLSRGAHIKGVREETEKLVKEEAKRQLIQRRRNAAGLEKETTFSSSVRSETPTGVVESMTTKFRAPKDDGDESAEALNKLLGGAGKVAPKSPEAIEAIQTAVRGSSPRVQQLLTNLTDPKAIDGYNYYRNYEGLSDIQAYRKALQEQGERAARGAVRPPPGVAPVPAQTPPLTKPAEKLAELLTPAPKVDPDQLRQSTHPSFYDEGFEGLEDATEIVQRRQAMSPSMFDDSFDNVPMAPGKSTIPQGAAERLAADVAKAPEDVAKQLTEASAIYNDPNATKEARNAAGKALRQLSAKLKNPDKGSTTLGAGLGGAQDILRIAQENPEFAASTVMGGLGAAALGAADASSGEDSWWDGAIAGATVGAAGPQMPKIIEAVKSQIDPTNLASVKEWAQWVAAKSPQIQRASLLANPQGLEQGMPALGMNAVAGPYGAVMTTAIESMFKNDPRGMRLMQLLDGYNPLTGFGIPKFMKGAWESAEEARQALVKGDGGRAELGGINPDSTLDNVLAYPGQAMTMGDIYARKLLKLAGYSDEEARIATLTAEPEQFHQVANWGKNNLLLQMMFPFRRTPANILEQGYKRIPGLGMIANKASGSDQAIEQTLGGLAGVGGYAVASNIDDDTTRRNVRRLMSNVGGRYSLPTSMGYFAGDAAARGLSPWGVVTNERNLDQLMPVPSTSVVADAGRKLRDLLQGNVDSPFDVIPTSMGFKPLRQFVGDNMASSGYPEVRNMLQVEPPPTRSIRIKKPRRPS